MRRRTLMLALAGTAAAGVLLGAAAPVNAADITLRVSHFLPPNSTAQKQLIEPWAQKVEKESNGRIKVEIFPAMQMGGKPPQLYDQVRDGIADVVWTLPGYTPGRFPAVEVFELPFVAASAEATSQAVQEFAEKHLMGDFKDVKPLLFHVHAPGDFHMKGVAIQKMEDLKGVKVRAPTRPINDALAAVGATPVGMPVPQVPEAMSKGVVNGTVLPWEVVTPLRVQEMTDSHTTFGGDRGFYTSVFLFAMNKAKYESLPADLKKVIDNNSGMAMAKQIGKAWDEAEKPGIKLAKEAGHKFYTIEGAELEKWKKTTQPVIDSWVKMMKDKGRDGETLLKEARALVAKYAGK